jgi:hypothetical protein
MEAHRRTGSPEVIRAPAAPPEPTTRNGPQPLDGSSPATLTGRLIPSPESARSPLWGAVTGAIEPANAPERSLWLSAWTPTIP